MKWAILNGYNISWATSNSKQLVLIVRRDVSGDYMVAC